MKFPPHKRGLYLEHNRHKDYYKTVAQSGINDECWVSEEEKAKAIATDELWTLQWYPDTSLGFYLLCASSLEVLLEAANKVENKS